MLMSMSTLGRYLLLNGCELPIAHLKELRGEPKVHECHLTIPNHGHRCLTFPFKRGPRARACGGRL